MQTSCHLILQHPNFPAGFFIVGENLLGMCVKNGSCLCQPHLFRRTMQQLSPQLVLQIADMQTYTGLGQVQQLTRFGEMSLFGNGNKYPQGIYYHKNPSFSME
ncbi:hypothetical protein D3C81_1523150 [compost metagenome]